MKMYTGIKQILQYPKYGVSKWGTVVNLETGRFLKQSRQLKNGNPTGYAYVTLLLSSGTKRIGVHRLVAFAWIGNSPTGKPWVNHKDGDKGNNHVLNLEWMSISDNIKHSYSNLGRKPHGVAHPSYKRWG